MHVLPSPVYPLLQVQTAVPELFVQLALESQFPLFVKQGLTKETTTTKKIAVCDNKIAVRFPRGTPSPLYVLTLTITNSSIRIICTACIIIRATISNFP